MHVESARFNPRPFNQRSSMKGSIPPRRMGRRAARARPERRVDDVPCEPAAAGRRTGEEGPSQAKKKDEPKKEEPKKEEPPPPTRIRRQGPGRERLKAAEQGKPIPKSSPTAGSPADPGSGLPVVARKERIELATEPHSPSTWGRMRSSTTTRASPSAARASVFCTCRARGSPQGGAALLAARRIQQPERLSGETRRTCLVRARSRSRSCGQLLEAYLGYSATANTTRAPRRTSFRRSEI